MQIGSKEWSDLIIEGAAAFGIELNNDQTRQFAIHATELLLWNQKINLTAIIDPFEVAVKHFLDSISAARFIPEDATVLDIGTGGGFPGIPFKVLLPSLPVTLIDASRKKINFLKHVIRTLKLDNIEAVHIRAEDLAGDPLYRNRFHVIVSRAISSLKLIHRLALPLLADEGVILALKGDIPNDELNGLQGRGLDERNHSKIATPRFSVTVEKFHLPFLNSRRSIVIINSRR